MPLNQRLAEKIIETINPFDVELISVTSNIQGTFDVELNQNIYWKEQEKMENQIRDLGNINDIFYRDIA